jgi:hypothetical protein
LSTTQCGIGKKPGQDMPTEQISIAESNAVSSPCTSAD